MRTATILFCVVLLLAAGCAELPRSTNFRYSSQKQLQSVTHWQVIAKAAAERLKTVLGGQGFIEKDGSAPPIYIPDDDISPFGVAFRRYLITELMLINPRFRISNNPDEPLHLTWRTQLVGRNQYRLKPIGIPEFVAAEVVAALSGIRWTTSGPMAPHTEFILTTMVTLKGPKDHPPMILARYSDTFYINDGDWENYNYQLAGDAFSRSIAGKDEAWRRRLEQQGLLSR